MKDFPTAWACHHHASLWRWCSRVSVGFAPEIAFSLMAKKLHFSLIWREYLLPYVWGVFYMPFGKHQTFLLIFIWTLFRKAQLCGVYGLKWSYGQILQSPLWRFAAPSGLPLVSFLPLWLIPSLPGPWVWWAALSCKVCWGAIFFPFFNNGFNGALWDVQRFWYFL